AKPEKTFKFKNKEAFQDSMNDLIQKFEKIHLKLAVQIEDIFARVKRKTNPYYKPDTSKSLLAYIL
ncbi:7962_t:CDS:1, partial [Acaulospora morrowiae]